MFDNLIIGRLRVNMGNIYSKQGKHQQAIRMYRMALDQVPNANTTMRLMCTQKSRVLLYQIMLKFETFTLFHKLNAS